MKGRLIQEEQEAIKKIDKERRIQIDEDVP